MERGNRKAVELRHRSGQGPLGTVRQRAILPGVGWGAGKHRSKEVVSWALDAELVFVKDWGEGKGRGTVGRAPG